MPSFSFLSGGIMKINPRATDAMHRTGFQIGCFMVVPHARQTMAGRVLRPTSLKNEDERGLWLRDTWSGPVRAPSLSDEFHKTGRWRPQVRGKTGPASPQPPDPRRS